MSVDPEGYITDISDAGHLDSRAGVEFYNGILTAGLVHAHCHLELSYMQGAIPEGTDLAGFARAMSAGRETADAARRARAAAYWDARMWAEGVQAVADVCNGDSTFPLKEASPVAYRNFAEVFGLRTTGIGHALDLCGRAREAGLWCAVTPHSTYSLNDPVFRAAIDAGGDPLSVHFMESPQESELFRRRGGLWEWYESNGLETDFLHAASPVERIVRNVPAGRNILLVHNTFISDEDVAALAAHFGDRATFVLCPLSNDYISRALPPVERLRRAGVRIALGTDSLASNRELSLVGEMRRLGNVPLTELFDWATLGGAQALGLDAELGSLEVGKRPGVVLFEGLDFENMALTPETTTRRLV